MICLKSLKGQFLVIVFITLTALSFGCSATEDAAFSSNTVITDNAGKSEAKKILRGAYGTSSAVAITWSAEDLDESFSMVDAVLVTLRENSILVEGEGALINGNTLTINSAGTYILSGELKNGQILVDAGNDDQIRLILNGVDLSNSDSAPLYILRAGGTVITLAEETVNILTGGEERDLTGNTREPDGVLYSNSKLTINGSGTLIIVGKNRHGIVSKNDLKIINGTVKVNAADIGIRGRNLVAVRNAHIAVKAGSDGIQAKNDQDPKLGIVYIENGVIDIIAAVKGIQAAANLVVLDSEILIESGLENKVTGIDHL
jgi:hypothetical protein